jgi:methyl-accepting chemotaxis protein
LYNDVETIAVPVQKQSNALQIKLLNMMKINALGFTQNDTASLINSHQRLTQFNIGYLSAISTLKNKLAKQP